jgi:hypothetical protein
MKNFNQSENLALKTGVAIAGIFAVLLLCSGAIQIVPGSAGIGTLPGTGLNCFLYNTNGVLGTDSGFRRTNSSNLNGIIIGSLYIGTPYGYPTDTTQICIYHTNLLTGLGDYLLYDSLGTSTYLNGSTYSGLRVGNAAKLTASATTLDCNSLILTKFTLPIEAGGSGALTTAKHTYLVNSDNALVTLPTAAGNTGLRFTVKLITPCIAATLTNATGAQLIDGALSRSVLLSNTVCVLQSDGTGWWVVGN